jgi:elongation factor 1-beta
MGKKNQSNTPAQSDVGTLKDFNALEICPAQDDSLKDLNNYLSNKSFIIGWGLSASDEAVYCKCSNSLDASKYPHVSRWANFVGSFSPSVRQSWGGDEVDVYDEEDDDGEEEAKADKAEESDSDSDMDMDFDDLVDGDDDEETKQMMEKHKERIAEIQARQAAKKGKAKTNITIDVNPEDETTDMEDLQQRVTEVEIPGLKWLGEGNLIPTCFGMSKLTIMCQIFDEQVPSTQVIYDALEELEGVGSTREIASQMA